MQYLIILNDNAIEYAVFNVKWKLLNMWYLIILNDNAIEYVVFGLPWWLKW